MENEIDVTQPISKLFKKLVKKEKLHNHFNRCRKSIDKVEHSFLLKKKEIFSKLKMEFSQPDISNPEELTANIILNDEKTECFSPKI